MTRKVRCGNTQKHTKMPEDATPWEELSRDIKASAQSRNQSCKIKVKEKTDDTIEKSTTEKKANKAEETAQEHEVTQNTQGKRKKSNAAHEAEETVQKQDVTESTPGKKHKRKKSKITNEAEEIIEEHDGTQETQGKRNKFETANEGEETVEEQDVTETTPGKKHKRKKSIITNEADENIEEQDVTQESKGKRKKFKTENEAEETVEEQDGTQEAQGKRKKFKKPKKFDMTEDDSQNASENTTQETEGTIQDNSEEGNQDKKVPKFSKKDKINKKKVFQQKMLQRRIENGVTLLQPNQERKIYLLKKKLREKGYPPEMIKDIARKKRREEEIKFRKTVTNKTCFHCREWGHLLSNCPKRLGEAKQVTGVCFKCGSTEHVSYRCQKRIEGYPLAKCFICKEQGHISKECPKNQRGVYIKGGACRECGNVNHLQKDCPLLVKKKEDPSISLYTIQDGTSIDAEIVDDGPIRKKKFKKPKVVKF